MPYESITGKNRHFLANDNNKIANQRFEKPINREQISLFTSRTEYSIQYGYFFQATSARLRDHLRDE
jgi:hypothetical protein